MLDFIGAPEYSVRPLPWDALEQSPKALSNDINRPINLGILTGALSSAVGSCFVEKANTKVMAIVKGPYPLPKSQQEASKAILRIKVMPTLACVESMTEEAVVKTTQYFKLLESTLKNSFESVILLDRHPRMVIDIFVHILSNEGDICTVSTVACSAALTQSQVHMSDLLIGFSFSKTNSIICINPEKDDQVRDILHVTYAPTLQKYASIHGYGNFNKLDFTTLDDCVRKQSEHILKNLKKSLLTYSQEYNE